jgi:glycosyltransferase involved in cell wall biosynthesis
LLTHLFAVYLCRISKSKLIKECSEHPLRDFKGNTWRKKQGLMKNYIESHLSDGIFCISKFLIDFFNKNGIDEQKLLLVPSTVDPGRFNEIGERPFEFEYIGYFGGLTFNRDKVNILIQAFSKLCLTNQSLYLVLGGFCTIQELAQIENLIKELELSSKVILLKYLSRQEIIKYIAHSYILVNTRSNDIETQASFPSKLTEFLATAKPVVTVSVGEIPDYLTDGVEAFLVEPGNSDALANKLNFVCNNYDIAMEVGGNGNKLVYEIFNYNFQSRRMIEFIKKIL